MHILYKKNWVPRGQAKPRSGRKPTKRKFHPPTFIPTISPWRSGAANTAMTNGIPTFLPFGSVSRLGGQRPRWAKREDE